LSGDVQHVDEMFGNGPLACWNPTIADSGWQRLQRIEDETLLRGIPDVVTKLLFPEGARAMLAAVPGPVLGIAANALESLQHQQALIVQGVDGSLDPSTLETTRGMRLISGIKAPLRIHPGDYALFETDEPYLSDGDQIESAVAITRQVLLGVACPELSSTLMSAGLIISLANPNESVATCIAQASEAVRSGAAQRLLSSFRNGN
jgi:anthranilate phosphoribosyltransferase